MAKSDSPGFGSETATYEDLLKVDTDQKGSSTSSCSSQKKDIDYEYSKSVGKYLEKIEEGGVPIKRTPPRWFFEKIHEEQKYHWETVAALRGWIIEHLRKDNGNKGELLDWKTVTETLLTHFYGFDRSDIQGLRTETDLYQDIWSLCHEGREPLSDFNVL